MGITDNRLQKAMDWADFLLKVVSIIAIVIGGLWAYFQFDLSRAAIDNIQMTVSSESQPYGNDTRLLLIHVKPKNIGKVLVMPGKSGFVVTVRKIPGDLKQGVVGLEKIPELYKVDLMKRFPDGYELEPGVEYDEVVAVVVPKRSSYAVKALFGVGDDEVDHTAVARVE